MTSGGRVRAWTSAATEGHLDLQNGCRQTKDSCRRERHKDSDGNRTNAYVGDVKLAIISSSDDCGSQKTVSETPERCSFIWRSAVID